MEWNDGSVNWVPLKDLKQSNPVELAKYVRSNSISGERVFIWWVMETLSFQNRIISKVKYNYCYTPHNFLIKLHNTVKEAYKIVRQPETYSWTKAILKEMANLHIKFKDLDCVTPSEMMKGKFRPGYDKIRPQYVRQKYTKDTIGRYIVLLPEEKADSCQRDGK